MAWIRTCIILLWQGNLNSMICSSTCERSGIHCERKGIHCDRRGIHCERRGIHCERRGIHCERRGIHCERRGIHCETRLANTLAGKQIRVLHGVLNDHKTY